MFLPAWTEAVKEVLPRKIFAMVFHFSMMIKRLPSLQTSYIDAINGNQYVSPSSWQYAQIDNF